MTLTVELGHVSKRYGKIKAVRDVSLVLNPGETVALVGHNGAGKTTLLKLMLGHIRPTSGTIRVLGADPVAGEFSTRSKIGFLPENVSFAPALTGREILSFYTRLKGAAEATTLELLERVGLGAASARRVGTYSKGMRQRLGLAQALIGDPQLMLLDEPTTGLDPALRLSFYEIVQALRSRGATVVLCTHALAELGDQADRVIIMNEGSMLAWGSMEELQRMARLPAKIRLTVSGKPETIGSWLGHDQTWHEVNGHVVEINATPERKIELLRRAMDVGTPVVDVAVMPPTLDDIYAYFLRTQGTGK